MGGDKKGPCHSHGHEQPYTIPSPDIYKIDNIPELLEVKKSLERQGLKDPWLRNEAWRYDPAEFGTKGYRARKFFLRGFGIGFAAFLATIAIEYTFFRDDSHGHHGHNNKDNE